MGEIKVKPQRKSEVIIGVLFLLATASYMFGSGLVEAALKVTDFNDINAEQIKTGVLLELINSAAVVGIAALLFPILRKYSEGLTMIYVSSRIIESALLLIAAIAPLLFITLNQVEAQQLNAMVTLFADYSFQMAMVSLSAGSVFFCYILYKNRLIPRSLSTLGFIGYLLLLASSLLSIIGFEDTTLFYIPGALFEIIFPFWLLIKGFGSQTTQKDKMVESIHGE
jgi:hypothetical protein